MKNCLNIFLILGVIFFIGCKEDDTVDLKPETSTVTDVEGNVYKTVKIGDQWWMIENLRVKKFQNGEDIPQIQAIDQWENNNTGAYCLYNNINSTPGLLYNWYAINGENEIAPEGWHVPTDEDWKVLERNLSMSQFESDETGWRGTNQGEKMKIEGTQAWERYKDIWATNESGFSASAGGCRLFNGVWCSPGLFNVGYWWSSSAEGEEAWFRYLDYKNADVFRYKAAKNHGFSIRCVKNQE